MIKWRIAALVAPVLAILAVACGAFWGSHSRAYAIPAYARQLGVSCEQCHTIWPRLNEFGRKFKVKGYVDAVPNPGFPLAARFMATAQTGTGVQAGVSFPSQVNVYVGTRLTPEVGVFSAFTFAPTTDTNGGTEWKAFVDEQKYAWNFLPGKAVSLVAFHSTIFGFDPFPSLGNLAFMGDYSTLTGLIGTAPGIMNTGELLAPFDTSGFGVAIHGFLDRTNHYYGAVGVESAGGPPDSLGLGIGAIDSSHNGLSFVTRFAYQGDIGDNGGNFNIGAAYFVGSQQPVIQLPTTGTLFGYHGEVNRLFFDGAVELPIGDNDMWELVALYGTGADSNFFAADPVAGVDGPFSASISGLYLQSDYYWNMKFGITGTYDTSTLGGITTNQWEAGPVYLPLKDLKVNINYGGVNDSLGDHTDAWQLILTKMF